MKQSYLYNQAPFLPNKKSQDKSKLILDVMVDETNFIVVNIYKLNTKTEQVTTYLDLGRMLKAIKDFSEKHIVLAGGFNFFFSMHPWIRTEANQL